MLCPYSGLTASGLSKIRNAVQKTVRSILGIALRPLAL